MNSKLSIFLIPFFVFSTIGVSITSLYCQGALYEIGFSVHPCCDDVNKGGCCETESVFLKIVDSFVKADDDAPVKIFSLEKPVIHYLLLPLVLLRQSSSNFRIRDHWQKKHLSSHYIRIFFCSFLI